MLTTKTPPYILDWHVQQKTHGSSFQIIVLFSSEFSFFGDHPMNSAYITGSLDLSIYLSILFTLEGWTQISATVIQFYPKYEIVLLLNFSPFVISFIQNFLPLVLIVSQQGETIQRAFLWVKKLSWIRFSELQAGLES